MAILLKLSGLSCQHCMNRVQQQLQQLTGVEQVKVSTQYAYVKGEITAEKVIESIEQAGYQAQIAQPDVFLALEGLSCGHCVASVKQALTAIDGVFWAEVEKTQAEIYGSVDKATLIDVVIKAGYQAK